MSIEADEIMKIAHLARLEVSASEVPQYAQELSRILDLVAQMNQIDTAQVEPLANPLDAMQRFREDVVSEGNQRAKSQAVAPSTDAGYYLVPRVIE